MKQQHLATRAPLDRPKFFAIGDTPLDALQAYQNNSAMCHHLLKLGYAIGDTVPIQIWTVISVPSHEPAPYLDNDGVKCRLGRLLFTRTIKNVQQPLGHNRG